MFLRIDRLQIELPRPTRADPKSAAALQELLGGKFGEMSTLNNYFFQSFNFRNKGKLKPFYSLVASITAEEFGHVELVTNGVKLVARGPDLDPATYNVTAAPFAAIRDARNTGNFFMGGGAALPVDSMATPWSGNYVFSTGNLILDLLHNFFLECGARIHKPRVYETVNDPVSREVCGYLMVRGAVHAHAYGLALKHLTGVDMTKMLPFPTSPATRSWRSGASCRRAPTGGCIASAPTTTPRSARSGAMASRRFPVIRPGSWRWLTGIPMERQDPRTRWHLRCLHARLPAGGDLRDREQALHGFQELSRGRGRGDRSGKGRPVFKGLGAVNALETTQIC